MAKTEDDFSKIEIRPWIKKKLAQHTETPRAGVPRGEDLPIPRHKYHAALLMLMYESSAAPDLAWIAKETGATYALIGKWRNERKFKKLTQELADEFMAGWFEFFLWLCKKRADHEGTKEEAAHEDFIDFLSEQCRVSWGVPLQISFFRRAETLIHKGGATLATTIRLVGTMEGWIWSGLSAKRKNWIIDMRKELMGATIESLKVKALEAVKAADQEKAGRIIGAMHQSFVKLSNNYWELARSKVVGEETGV